LYPSSTLKVKQKCQNALTQKIEEKRTSKVPLLRLDEAFSVN
jgi:hypothetical protein